MSFDSLKTALVTLMVTLDPPGLAPLFLGLATVMSGAQKREVALRASLIAFAILAFFAVAGWSVMNARGVSMPAFRIAGGVMLFYIAFDMIFALRGERKQEIASDAVTIDQIRNIAAFPLAIPLMAGPGSITATMLIAAQAHNDARALASLLAVIGLAMALTYLALIAAERVSVALGATGQIVLTRMLGVVLAALAVQFVLDGVRTLSGQAGL